jgi:hypothetical protein
VLKTEQCFQLFLFLGEIHHEAFTRKYPQQITANPTLQDERAASPAKHKHEEVASAIGGFQT